MGAPKLTRAQAWEIRRLVWAGHPQTAVAPQFGITQPAVSYIVNFRRFPLTSTESTSLPDPALAKPTRCPTCQARLTFRTTMLGALIESCPNHCP